MKKAASAVQAGKSRPVDEEGVQTLQAAPGEWCHSSWAGGDPGRGHMSDRPALVCAACACMKGENRPAHTL